MLKYVLIAILISQINSLLTGGRSIVDLNDETKFQQISDLALFGLATYNQKTKTENQLLGKPIVTLKLNKITKAQQQVVAGMNYYITVEVQDAGCSNQFCSTKTCEFTIWYKPWENFKMVTDSKCE